MTKILILGITGMLGHTLFTEFSQVPGYEVYGTVRSDKGLAEWLSAEMLVKVRTGIDAENTETIAAVIKDLQPDIVINCIGVIKQLDSAKDPITTITINSLLPHQVAKICESVGSRMIHISTDCVFSGNKGNYTENDQSDAEDLYGRTKYLGEVDYPHCLTMRTSIIGHELRSNYGLVDWFMSQQGKVRGFTNAIYTGFPTIEIARIRKEFVIPNPELKGLYQVSSEPINKYELLKLIAGKYSKPIEIEPYDEFKVDRSLNSERFRYVTGYVPPTWPELIDSMYQHFLRFTYYKKS
ncbi:MAG TPA: SDR family oxidoreductase [Desulfobacteria bacterium]|nr:SDR family oxidoreductase [Desulfobacteria bacterium]